MGARSDGNEALRVAAQLPSTEAEGPGRRYAIWLQGCPLRCPGCCNPEMLPLEGGALVPVAELVRAVIAAAGREGVEGLTLLGGEPFAQAPAAARLAEAVRGAGLGVMVFSGFTLAELEARAAFEPAVAALLATCDLLVDGRFERDRPERARRFIGSSNQVMYFLSSRYAPDDPRLRAPNSVEIRLGGGLLTVNGWPAAARALLR
jgi:anaerobic ribonucleoside-triphosphate reductase activating protein